MEFRIDGHMPDSQEKSRKFMFFNYVLKPVF
jgi:hypothetical protein